METHEPRHTDEHHDDTDAIEAIQRAEQAERMAAVSDFDAPPKKRRRWLKVSGALLLVLLVLAGVAPLVAGPVLRPIVEQRLADSLDATVRVERIVLNWFAGPRIEGVRILDDSLQEQADLTLRSRTPLFQLAISPRDLGDVDVSGSLLLERRPDGSIAPFPKPDPASTAEWALPDISATINADGLDVEWREINAEPARFVGITGSVGYQPAMLAGTLRFDVEHALGSAGVAIELDASDLANESGTLVFGSGGLAIDVEGDAAQLDLDVVLMRTDAGYRVTLVNDEVTAQIGGPVLAGVLPVLAELSATPVTVADGRTFTLDAVPGASLRLTDAAATLDPRTFALADTRFEAVIETGELIGTLDGERWTIDPLLASAATRNMFDGVDVEAVTSVTLGGRRAGELSLLADGLRVLQADGSFLGDPAAMIAGSRTTLDVSDASTAVLEPLIAPLLAGSGIVPSRDLGPRVSAELAVTSGAQTGLRLELESDNASAAIGLRIDDGVLRSTGDASRISVRSASGMLTSLLARAGVTVDEGAAIDIRLSELAFDLSAQADGKPLDLGALSGVVSVGIGETRGTVAFDGVDRPFVLRPSEAEVDLRRLRDRATLVAGAAIEIGGRSAGTLNVSVEAADVLDASGALRPGVPSLSGEIALRNARTAVLDTLLASWLDASPLAGRITADRLLGASADVLVIGTRGDNGQVRLQTTLTSGGFNGGGNLLIEGGEVSSAGAFRLEHTNAGAIAGDLLAGAHTGSLRAASGGSLAFALDSFRLGAQGVAAFEGTVAAEGIAIESDQGQTAAIERFNASASLLDGRGAVEINGLGSVGDRPMLAAGRLVFNGAAAESIAGTGDQPLWWLAPEGQIDAEIPIDIMSLIDPARADTWRELLGVAIGDLISVSLAATDGAMTLNATGSADATTAQLRATTGARSLRVEGGSIRTSISQEAVRQLQIARAVEAGSTGGPAAGPALASNAEVELVMSGFGLIDNGQLAPAGMANLRLTASGMIDGVHETTVMGSDGLPRRLRDGAIGVDGLLVEADLPLGAILGSETASLTGTVEGTLIGEDGVHIGALTGAIEAELASGAMAGSVSCRVEAPEVDTAALDDALHTDSFLSGLLGARASVAVELAGLGNGSRISDAGLTVDLDSPRLSAEGPLVFDIKADRVELASNAALQYRLDPVFATRHLLGQSVGTERIRLAEPVVAELIIDRLTLGRDGAPFRPGLFDAHVEVDAPRLVIEHRDEVDFGVDPTTAGWVRTDLSPLDGEVVTDPDNGAALKLTAAADAASSLLIELSLRGVAAGAPVLGVLVEGRGVPTQLIDGIGRYNGALAEIVGPTSLFRLALSELSSETGGVNFSVVGDRASASMIGRVESGVFRNTDPVEARIDVIRPQLGARLSRAVPALGRITKEREDGPATLIATNVELPLQAEQPLRGLNTDFTIDVGTARFQASRVFGDVLIFARQRSESQVGRKLEPMVGTVREGVLAYEPLELPLGEFTLTSEGSYDLVTKRTDVTTAVPLGALSDRAMGELNTGLGSSLSRLIPGLRELTMVPWRIRGTPGNLTVTPDVEAFTRQITRTINPVNIIGNIFGL